MLADPNTEPTLGEALEFSWHLHKLQESGQPWEGLSAFPGWDWPGPSISEGMVAKIILCGGHRGPRIQNKQIVLKHSFCGPRSQIPAEWAETILGSRVEGVAENTQENSEGQDGQSGWTPQKPDVRPGGPAGPRAWLRKAGPTARGMKYLKLRPYWVLGAF